MPNGNISENNTATANEFDYDAEFDRMEQEDDSFTDTEVIVGATKEGEAYIPDSANIFINDKLFDKKQIQAQIDAKVPGFENINTVEQYVDLWGDNARVEVGRDAFGNEITEEKAIKVDTKRAEDPVSNWAAKYDKNINPNDFKLEYEKYQNNLNLDDTQQSEVDAIIDPNNENYNPDLFKSYKKEKGFGRRKHTVTIQPHEEVLKESKKYLESKPRKILRSTGEAEPITQEQIENVARIMMRIEKEQDFYNSNAKDYLDNIPDELRKSLFNYKINEYVKGTYIDEEILEKEEKEIINLDEAIENSADFKNVNSYAKATQDLVVELKNLTKQLNVDVDTTNQEAVGNYNDTLNQYKQKVDQYNNVYGQLQDYVDNLDVVYDKRNKKLDKLLNKVKTFENQDDLKKELDFLKRNYSQLEKIFGEVGSGEPGTFAVGMVKAGIDLASFVDFQIFGTEGNPFNLGVQELGQTIRKYEDKQKDKFYKQITFENAFDSVSNFGEFALDQVVTQMPFFAAMSINPYSVLGISGGSYISDRQKEASTMGGRAYSDNELRLKSLGFGTAEYVFGVMPTMKIWRRAGANFAGANKRALTDVYKNRFQYYLKNKGVIAFDTLSESSTEGLTTFFQNGIDGRPLFEGMSETLFVGGMFGHTFSATPFLYGAATNNFSDFKSYEGYRTNLDMINRLNSVNNTPFISKKEIEQNNISIKELEAQNTEILNNVENKVNEELTPEGFNLYQNATDRQENLRTEAEQIINNKSLPKDVKDKKLNDLKKEFDDLQVHRDGFRESFTKTFPLLPKEDQSRLNDLAKKRLQAKDISNPSEEAISQEAESIYYSESIDKNAKNDIKMVNKLAKTGVDIKYDLSQTNKDAVNKYKEILDAHVANPDIDLTQKQADSRFNRFKKGIEDGTINGINSAVLNTKTNKNVYDVIVSKTNSIANNKQHTGIHEIGHTIFTEAFSSNPKAFQDLADGVLEYLQKTDPKAYTRVQARTVGQNADEVLTNFLEEVADGNINLEQSKRTGFLGAVGKLLGIGVSNASGSDYSFNFKGETDIANFLTNLGKKLKAGDLSVKDIRTIKEEGIAGRKVGQVDIKPEDKLSKTQDKVITKDVKYRLDELTGPAEARKYDSQQDFISSPDYLGSFNALTSPDNNLLNAKIKNIAAGKGVDRINVQQVKDNLIKRFTENFNIEKNSLFGWLLGKNPALEYAVLDIIKEETAKIKTGPTIGQPVGEGEVAFDVADTSMSIEDMVDQSLSNQDNVPRSKLGQGLTLNGEKFVDQDLEDSIETAVIETFEGDIPSVDSKEFKDFISDVIKNKVRKAIQNKIKSKENFGQFLKENLMIFKEGGVSLADLVQLERAESNKVFGEQVKTNLSPKEVDKAVSENRLPKNVNRLSGPTLYDYGSPNLKQKRNFFFGDNVKRSTQGTRKDAIVNAVAARLTFDMMPEQAEIAGMPEVDIAKMSANVDVDVNLKFSESIKTNAEATRVINAFTQGSVNKSRIQERKDRGLKSNPKDSKEDYKIINRDQKLPKEVAFFKNETVFKGTTRIINRFLKDYPQHDLYLQQSFVFGLDRSIGGTISLYRKHVSVNKKVNQTQGKRTSYTFNKTLSKPWVESTKDKNYVSSEISKLENIFQFYRDLNTYLKDNPRDYWILDSISMHAQNSQSSPLRSNAPILIREVDNNKKPLYNVQGVEEHSQPQNQVGTLLSSGIRDGNLENIIKVIKATYMQGFISKQNNDKLDINFKKKMPENYYDIINSVINGEINIDPGLLSTIRFTEAGVDLNKLEYIPTNQTIGEYFFGNNVTPIKKQKELINDLFTGQKSLKEIKDYAKKYEPISTSEIKTSKVNKKNISVLKNVESIDNQVEVLANYDDALKFSRSVNKPKKGISVFDFDDTLAKTKEKVIVNMPYYAPGSTAEATMELTPAEFAERAQDLEDMGAAFDFSQFENVKGAKKGPLADLALKRQGKFGSGDIFVLTARPQNSAQGIKTFLDGIGLNIPIENITGLEDGSPQAKANWVVDKVAKGYNDFYFADDVGKNVKAVQDVLDVADIKNDVQQVKLSESKTLDRNFNDIIEQTKGVAWYKEYSKARAKAIGKKKNTFHLIPHSAEDFAGLLYPLLGKGKIGDNQFMWLKEKLLNPIARAERTITREQVGVATDYKALKKNFPKIPKTLQKQAIEGYTHSDVIRVYIWNKQGMDIPGLSKSDMKEINDFMKENQDIQVFADGIMRIQKGKQYPEPTETWQAGTITTDMLDNIRKVNRTEYLAEFNENVDIIFSEKNKNKLRAIYGNNYVEALENSIERIKKGTNKLNSGNKMVNNILDWVNGSVGAIMFLNARSAALQLISSINFINWNDNNILKAGKAFANQPQYWKDVSFLMNSPMLVKRRQGLKINVSESEIADAAKSDGVKGAINYMLKKGFILTQIADSFAIASGGASFYRNRIKTYKKQGMEEKAAEDQAFLDFQEIAEENQQSSRTDKISMQQASDIGRVILAFANTPMQYNRLIKKASSDLINRRGDWKTNISKIVYYGAIQNVVFNALQNAMFALMFDDDDEIPQDKAIRTANGMADSLLRGMGYGGAAVSTFKNVILKLYEESEKSRPKYEDAALELLDFSPPISSKVTKMRSALRTLSWNADEIYEKGFNLDNPGYLAGGQILSSTLNIPLDRVFKKYNNISSAMREDTEIWQKIALLSGWSDWELGIQNQDRAYKKLGNSKLKLKTFKLKKY